MQPSYRAIFTEMLLAQSAAVGAFAVVAGHCAQLAGQQYQQALLTLARKIPPNSGTGASARPGGETTFPGASSASLADLCRAFASVPRVSMMIFLSRYDDLRGRRGVVEE